VLNFIIRLGLIILFSGIVSQQLLFPLFNDQLILPFLKWETNYLNQGTVKTLVDELESVELDERAQRFSQLQDAYGYNLELRDLDQLVFTVKEREAIDQRKVVVTEDQSSNHLVGNSGQVLTVQDRRIIPHHLMGSGKRMGMGDFYIIQQRLAKESPTAWGGIVEDVAKNYTFPVNILPLGSIDLTLNYREREDLLAGYLVALSNEASSGLDFPADYILQKVASSDEILVWGPISDNANNFKISAFSTYYGLGAFFVLLPLLLWLTPTWLSILSLSRATQAFGRGELATRAKVFRGSNLNNYASSYNTMADRIQELFNSHKMLTSAVSHDLRTPLARLEFSLELLKTTDDEPRREKQLERMEASIDELNRLVSEILLYAKFDREKPEFSQVNVNADAWIERELVSWRQRKPEISLDRKIDVSGPVCMEQYYMNRALNNLIANALRYAQERVCVGLRESKGHYYLSVEDDGPGVPPEDRDKVFAPFERLEKSRNRDSGGTGLGLAIVKQIAVWHGGEVWVTHSELGGAKFVVKWPKARG